MRIFNTKFENNLVITSDKLESINLKINKQKPYMIFLADQNPTSAPLNNQNFINETKFLSFLKTLNSAVQHTSPAW